jgi:hypothetical protein
VASPLAPPGCRCGRCAATIVDSARGVVLLRGDTPTRLLCGSCVIRPDEQHTASVPIDRYVLDALGQGGVEAAMAALTELASLRPDVVLAA